MYYAQAWSTVWDDEPLMKNRIEAWANGPVVRELYDAHKGRFTLRAGDLGKGDPATLTKSQRGTIKAVLKAYGAKSAQWLSDQTHSEAPWRMARKGLDDGDRGSSEITLDSMADYYGSLR